MSENATKNPTPPVSPPEGGEQAPKRNRFEKKGEKKRLPKAVRIGIPVALVSAILIGVVSFIRGNVSGESGEILEATAFTGSLSTYVTGWGSISPVSKAEYGKDIKGEVTDVAVEAGDIVKVGDLLFSIDPTEMKAELLEEKTNLANLEKQLRDLDKNYAKALETLEDAGEAYEGSTLRAPFNGTVIEAAENLPKVGDPLSTGAVLGRIVDDSAMKLQLFFNRTYFNDIAVGQTAYISVPDSMSQVTGTVTAKYDMNKPIDNTPCFGVEVKITNQGGLAEGSEATGYIAAPSGNIMPSQGGKLEYWQDEDIVFKGVTADVTAVNFRQYSSFSKGDAMLSVDPSAAADALDDARYMVETYARQKSDDFIQNDIKKSQEKIAELEQICSTSSFYSTIDGQVSAVMIKPGDKLTASETAVLTVSDTSSLVINADIDEADISNIKVGMSVEISYDKTDGSGMAMGTITYVSFEAKTSTGDGGSAYAYFPATISLENDGSLLPGMGVNYSILAVSKDSCLIVPSQCIVNTEEGPVVYVKNGQDFGYEAVDLGEGVVPEGYYAVRVEVGIGDAENTEIVSGIEEGTVVYQGQMTQDSGYWY